MKKFLLLSFSLAVAAFALPLTTANAADGTVTVSFSPTTGSAVSPGSSVTFSLSMVVSDFTDSDMVAGYDFTLTSLDLSSGAFFVQTRALDISKFDDDQAISPTTRPGSNLDPTNNTDLGASVSSFPNNLAGNGTYHLQDIVIGLDAGITPGTYNFTTSTDFTGTPGFSWTDESSDTFTILPATFSITVSEVPEPSTWFAGLGTAAVLGFLMLRCRRRA
jgi:hypothetical protein